jgi:acetolactate synthase-1/2/3 large subunit
MRFSDRVTGNIKTYAKQAKIIHLDIDQSEIDKNVRTTVAVVADCKESLPAITALLDKQQHQEYKPFLIHIKYNVGREPFIISTSYKL